MIKVKHLSSSSKTGEIVEIDKHRVSFGRGPENDVVFSSEEDRLVSTSHAEIYLTLERLWIRDLESRNGTFVNGKRIKKPTLLNPGDVIRFGKKGPQIVASSPIVPFDACAEANPNKGIGLTTLRRIVGQSRTAQRANFRKQLLLLALILVVVFAGASIFMETEHRKKFDRASSDNSENARAVAKEVADRRARRTAEEVAEGTAREVAKKEAAGVAKQVATDETRKLQKSFSDVFAGMEPSVYPVFSRTSLGKGKGSIDLKGGGTAWVVAPGVLATNAHVAANFAKLKAQGGGLVIRTTAQPPQEVLVDKVLIHPGYQQWAELRNEFRPIDKGAFDFLGLFPACDVALMYVKADDANKLGQPLKLASDDTLMKLKRGTPLAFLGYSVEGSTTGALNRGEASSDVGQLSQALDFFLEKTTAAHRHLLTYNLRTAGGASGSPVFNLNGEVVAVHNAGNYKFLGGERISQGTTNAGQRVDVLKELLEGKAEAQMLIRNKIWRAQFATAWKRGHDVDQILRILAFKHVPGIIGTDMLSRRFVNLERQSLRIEAGKKSKFTFKLRSANPWFVIAMPGGTEFHKVGLGGFEDVKAESWLAMTIRAGGGRGVEVNFDVFTSSDSKKAADVEVAVFQLF